MRARAIAYFVIVIFSITKVHAQTYEPLELATKIFGKENFNAKKFIKGEYEGRPNGKDLQAGSTTNFKLLGQTDSKAVVAMTILDASGKGLDTYLHFEKDGHWKMNAFRALAMTGIIDQVKIELEKMTPQQVDSAIAEAKVNKDSRTLFSSREEYDFELGNARLVLELDDNIVKHFSENAKEFERLKDLAFTQLGDKKPDGDRGMPLIVEHKSDYQKLFIHSVSTGGYELGNCIKFMIGGMVDNTVGYFYVKDKKDVPEMNADRVIMVREIGNGWYIYKTT